jgi:magnesium transporter
MKADNPLSREFLLTYPAEAARVLEQVSAEHVAALFLELSPQMAASVMASMLPQKAAACLQRMDMAMLTKLLAELPVSSAARIYRLLSVALQEELPARLPDKSWGPIRRYLAYPPEAIGALLNPNVDMLPENVTVGEAMRRIERLGHAVGSELYIIDDAHRLVGMLETGRLLASNHHARLRDIMNRKLQPLSVHVSATSAMLHPAWKTRRQLPVVERDNTLLGMLEYSSLQEMLSTKEDIVAHDPLANLISLAGLYWLSLAQLLDSLMSTSRYGRGRRP